MTAARGQHLHSRFSGNQRQHPPQFPVVYLAVGEEVGQRDVTRLVVEHSDFFGIVADLHATVPVARDVEGAAKG